MLQTFHQKSLQLFGITAMAFGSLNSSKAPTKRETRNGLQQMEHSWGGPAGVSTMQRKDHTLTSLGCKVTIPEWWMTKKA